MAPPHKADTTVFLPAFCHVNRVFAVVVIGELLAVVLALAPSHTPNFWHRLSQTSLFVQWVALLSCGALCISRIWLQRFAAAHIGIISYVIVLLITVFVSEVAFYVTDTATSNALNEEHVLFTLRNLTLSAIFSAIGLRYLYLTHQLRTQLEAQSQARIQALQARIRPHFLFNSMNTIASLARREPALAESVVEDLADLFRASLQETQTQSTLAEELDLAQRYLNIEQLRLGSRLTIDWQLDNAPMHLPLPPLTLQPLLENAVYHGIEPQEYGGTVVVSGAWASKHYVLSIRNPIAPNTARGRPGLHMATDNIEQRLALHYGGEAFIRAQSQEGLYTVALHIPFNAAPPGG